MLNWYRVEYLDNYFWFGLWLFLAQCQLYRDYRSY
jgi:hypothetical protein